MTAPTTIPTFTLLGDAALSVATPLARELLADLAQRPAAGVRETIPALDVLTVLYDPLKVRPSELQQELCERLSRLQPLPDAQARHLTIPVCFDGPDLSWCAQHVGVSEDAFVDAVCAAPLEVAFLGFTPGFAFLTGLPPELRMPRLAAPRERLPAGSVALGGPWAGVYPRETPGGWRIVGQTKVQLFDLSRPQPVLWQPGDHVRFVREADHV